MIIDILTAVCPHFKMDCCEGDDIPLSASEGVELASLAEES
jgi:hypothetical protein